MEYRQKNAPPPGDDPDEFVMSDASVDRMGDVIEQDGWRFDKVSTVALFNHDRSKIIGSWRDVGVKDGRLVGRLEWSKSSEWPMLNYLRDLVREGHLRACSVGFQPIEAEPLNKSNPTKGQRFKRNDLLECSLVSVPANPNALALAKELPRDAVAEIFCKPANKDSETGASGNGKTAETHFAKSWNRKMQIPLGARIVTAQADLQALRENLKELASYENLSAEQSEQYDGLPERIETAKAELEKHQRAERALMDGQTPAAPPASAPITVPTSDITPPNAAPMARVFAAPRKAVEPGDLLMRSIVTWAKSVAMHENDLIKQAREIYGGQVSDQMQMVLRAAVNPAQTTVATWAAELVQTENAAFLDRLIPNFVYPQLAAAGQRYTFGSNASIKIPVRSNTPTLAGNWVAEGIPKPVKKAGFTLVTLVPNKLSVITTATEEMLTYTPYSMENILRQAMSDDTGQALDSFLIDAVASSASRPAGLLNVAAWGTATITPSAATPATAAMVADLKACVAALTALNGGRKVVILLNPAQALALSFAQTTTGDFLFDDRSQAGGKFGVSFIVSNTVPAARVIAVDAEDFASATGDSPRFAVSTDATIYEEDTTPLAIASGAQGSGVLATPTRSLFQTDSVAIRMSLYVSWAMRRSGMVQTISPVIW